MIKNSVSIKNISKRYKLYDSRHARLKEWLLPFGAASYREKWVLKDINLEVHAGEAIGIVGLNGAGKSTLLKIITGTTMPTTGSVEFNGTVAALLELGLGFHPDFTGRQNVYMSGQLLGYKVEEIAAGMEHIESFAEIGDAIDAPVRTYSSGMQVRLAFSVATMKRPDILIVDEALSVGDSYFQHKSFNRIKEFCEAGTTLLLVSHDASAIQAVCDRAVLLDHGQVKMIGAPQEIMDYYNAMLGDIKATSIRQERLPDGQVKTVSGNGMARIDSVCLYNSKDIQAEILDVGEHVKIKIHASVIENLEELTCGILIKNRLGESIYGVNTNCCHKEFHNLEAGEQVDYNFSFPMNIGPGNYSLTVALHGGKEHVANNYEWRDLAVVFEVVNQTKNDFAGMAFLDADIESERFASKK